MLIKKTEGVITECVALGMRIFFFTENLEDVIQRYHAEGHFYENEELLIISQHVQKQARILDIGANIGNHAIYFAKFLEPVELVTIEPNPAAFNILKVNIALNGLTCVDISYLGLGFGAAVGKFAIDIPPNNLGGAKLTHTEGAATIDVLPGDFLFSNRQFDFIKIDVEGMELDVLQGLSAHITRFKPVIFVEVDNANRAGFDDWLEKNGYIIRAQHARYQWNENFLIVPT